MKLQFDAEEMGKKIEHYRKQRGMTRADLASAIGCSQQAISILECGNADPRLSGITNIANALGVEPSWLLAWKPEDEE
ncbi:helix-turn-helix transcriptional regulator [Proteiniclasticum sp. QWL-01]|uniref:helix-turn-helix domain-containing protein n=1 Tax=Proteiniclasticum sp. QWL-01 TaxID=3036945 RepID=UPI0024114BDE|nr:helix-turn-helix transcriptional regulator [Proteiniclasticum sp. QWL-01]WFF73988.1 helix-turn-helix transcriptional regulator [Proteiniclasticum sp. QWL-01]